VDVVSTRQPEELLVEKLLKYGASPFLDSMPLDVAESSKVTRMLPIERYLTAVDVFFDEC
jgi:hypothetical protein